MSSSWRIRHKLMLGLVLAIGVLALLLCGTLRGLWSYYNTTDSIRGSTRELKAAEDFKESVTVLTSPDGLRLQVRNPSDAEAIKVFKEVRKNLADYEYQLDDNLNQNRAGASGLRTGLVQDLRRQIGELEAGVNQLVSRRVALGKDDDEDNDDPNVNKLIPPGDDSREMIRILQDYGIHRGINVFMEYTFFKRLKDDLKKKAKELTLTARDLQSVIHKDLTDSLGETRRHYQITLWIIVPTSVAGLVMLLGLMRSFYTWIMYPIRDLNAGVARVAAGDFAHRIEINSGDEMQDLSAAFNDMTSHLQTLYSDLARQVNERSRQLVRSERLASVGFLAAGVAHEINNPLASIAFSSEALEARLADLLRQLPAGVRRGDELEVFTRYLKMIQEEAFRCKNITERLLSFSRTGEFRREPTDMAAIVQSVLDVTQHLQNCKGKEIIFEGPQSRVTAPVNAEEIKSVILNLVVNALDSMEDGGRLVIRLAQAGRQAEVSFMDTGCGMSQEVLDNIFEPFFTQSRTGKGTGLGLTISHRIVEQHNGEIEAASAGPGQGSTFTVRLPLDVPAAQAAA